jgi:hypothetical protein
LYAAITGVPPYLGGARNDILARITRGKPMPLSDLGVDEPALQRLLDAGLDPDRRTRVSDLGDLKKALDCFDRGVPLPERYVAPAVPRLRMESRPGTETVPELDDGIVFDEASLPADPSAAEADPEPIEPAAPTPDPRPPIASPVVPQAPRAVAPVIQVARPVPPPKSRPPIVAIAAGVLGVAVLAGGFVWWRTTSAPGATPAAVVPTTSSTEPVAAESAAPVRARPRDDRDACIASYFADNTFDENTKFAFVCASDALADVSRELYALLRAHDPLADETKDAGARNGALVIRGEREAKNPDLGWYELAATAIIRQGCCKGASPPTLPKTEGWCPQLDDRVRVLAEQSTTPADLAPFAKKFDEAASCLFATHTKHTYAWTAPPSDADRTSFQLFLSHAAITDAKRSSLMRP